MLSTGRRRTIQLIKQQQQQQQQQQHNKIKQNHRIVKHAEIIRSMVSTSITMSIDTKKLADAILNNGTLLSSSNDNTDIKTTRTATATCNSNINRSRLALSRAITLIESKSYKHQIQAELLLNYLSENRCSLNQDSTSSKKDCFRIGIAGPPGAGKSTLIETLGKYILNQTRRSKEDDSNSNNKLAVLCIDPSSSISGGSILGDKTRMTELSKHPNAYVRPSPTSGTLGGLSSTTNDVLHLISSASYNYCFIETVGLGQSEIEINQVVDLLVLVIPPGGGDELQGVKKGIVELADMLVVNKSDGVLEKQAMITAGEYKSALGLLRIRDGEEMTPSVLLVSAQTNKGIKETWDEIIGIEERRIQSGLLKQRRQKQSQYWMWKYIQDLIMQRTSSREEGGAMVHERKQLEELLLEGRISPRGAARQLLDVLYTTPLSAESKKES